MKVSYDSLCTNGTRKEYLRDRLAKTVGLDGIEEFCLWFDQYCIKDRTRFPLPLDAFLADQVIERAKTFQAKKLSGEVDPITYPPGYAQYKTGIRKCRNN
jgi:hypothetical protein